MTHSPFAFLDNFRDDVAVSFLGKEARCHSDESEKEALGISHVVSVNQVHGAHILHAKDASSGREADGIVTDTVGLTLLIRAADCQQIFVFDPGRRVVGVLHCGWKGLLAGAIPSFFASLESLWNIDPADTYVGVGPSLCLDCSEFSDPLRELPGIDPKFFHGRHVDLRDIADSTMRGLGVKHLERSPDCTKCQKDIYYSYRGDPEMVKAGYRNILACKLLEK